LQTVSGKVSGDYREYSRFRETFTGDAVRSRLRVGGGVDFTPYRSLPQPATPAFGVALQETRELKC
jgi:hypothetical protein